MNQHICGIKSLVNLVFWISRQERFAYNSHFLMQNNSLACVHKPTTLYCSLAQLESVDSTSTVRSWTLNH